MRKTNKKSSNHSPGLACKLSTPELQKRKQTVIASLRRQILQSKELTNGYRFRFAGTDLMIDELAEFVKTERQCCPFFLFDLQIAGDQSESWLALTGKEGVKDFIRTELAFIE